MNQNIYGDELLEGIDGRGVDISIQRADDLDKKSIDHISKKDSPKVLDLGSGAGGHSLRMAKAGAIVTAVDNHDFSEDFKRLKTSNNIRDESLQFISGNITKLPHVLQGQVFDDIYSQRTFHYLKYLDALEVLSFLQQIVKDKVFLSVTGIGTEIGDGYEGKTIPIESRFFKVTEEVQKKHHIIEPVCLYSKDELVELLEKSGWIVEECWESEFGNIKAVGHH